MAKSLDQTASFMMLCIPDFANKLWIPTKFVRKYREITEKKYVVLQTDSESCWDVKIKRMDGDFYMTDGWPEFVKDNELTDFDFLTFRLLPGLASFKVSVYGSNGCPKHPASLSSAGINEYVLSCGDDDGVEDEDEDEDDDDDDVVDVIKAKLDEDVRNKRVFGSKSGAGRITPKYVLQDEEEDDDDDDDDDDEDEDDNEDVDEVKARSNENVKKMRVFGSKSRPRGRPPKIVLQDEEDNDDEDDDDNEDVDEIKARSYENVRKMRVFGSKSRPRGRPPKIVLQGTKVSMNRRQSKARNDAVSVGSSNGNPLYYEKCLKHYQCSRFSLPTRFKKAGDLMDRNYVKMEFVASGYCRHVALDHLENRIDLATGWSEFRKANKIAFGKTYSFEYNPEQNVIYVKQVKKHN